MNPRRTLLFALMALFTALGPVEALADRAPPENGAEASASGADARDFRPMTGPAEEPVPGGSLMLGAYVALFSLLLLYVVRLGRMQRSVEAQADELDEAIREAGDA